jgi:hypothetical protein
MKGVQATGETFSSQKKTSSTSKHEISSLFTTFMGQFFHSWIRIRIQPTKTMRIRIHNTAFPERISYFLLPLTFSPSHLHTFTPSHLSPSHLPSYLLIFFQGYLLTISSYLLMCLLTFSPLTSCFTFCRVFWSEDLAVPEHVHRGENHPGQVDRYVAHSHHPHSLCVQIDVQVLKSRPSCADFTVLVGKKYFRISQTFCATKNNNCFRKVLILSKNIPSTNLTFLHL